MKPIKGKAATTSFFIAHTNENNYTLVVRKMGRRNKEINEFERRTRENLCPGINHLPISLHTISPVCNQRYHSSDLPKETMPI